MSNPAANMSELSSMHNNPNYFGRVEKAGSYERALRSNDLELKIIYSRLKKSKEEQIDELKKSYKWEIEALRHEMTSEADGKIAQEICQLGKAKELRLLQQEDFARKDVEIEAEKLKRKIMTQFEEDKFKLEQEHQDTLAHLRHTFDKKLSIGKQKLEVKNDKLFEAENVCQQFTADIELINQDVDKNIDKRILQLSKQMRADTEHYRRTLHEHKEGKVLQIRNELSL